MNKGYEDTLIFNVITNSLEPEIIPDIQAIALILRENPEFGILFKIEIVQSELEVVENSISLLEEMIEMLKQVHSIPESQIRLSDDFLVNPNGESEIGYRIYMNWIK